MALIIVDCETTGLDPADAGVWDLAAVAVRNGEIVSRFETLIWPGREFLQARHREVMLKCSGVEVGWLLDQEPPDAEDAAFGLHNWLYDVSAGERPVRITSFNVPFDQSFLDREPFDFDLAWKNGSVTWGPCVMEAAARRLGFGKRVSLPRACGLFGIPFAETHRALADADAAAQIAILLRLEGTAE